MSILLHYYGFTLLAAVLAAVLLGFVGSQFVAQKKVMQVFCFSQAAVLGVLVGTLLAQHQPALAVVMGAAFAVATFFVAERFLATGNPVLLNARLLVLYVSLLALSYGVASYFPALENHMAQAFFGDVVTLTSDGATLLLVLTIAGIPGVIFFHRVLLRDSLDVCLLGQPIVMQRLSWWLANAFYASSVVCCIYTLGAIYTTGMLFFAVVLLQTFSAAGGFSLRVFLVMVAGSNAVATMLGFIASFLQPRLSTVPTILVLLVGLCIISSLTGKILSATRPQQN